MQFLMLFKPTQEPPVGEHACRQDVPEMAALIEELKQAGILLSTHGLLPSDSGARLRYERGEMTITDGPFAEAKELVAGVAHICVDSKSQAIALAERFLKLAGEGQSDVLEVAEPIASAR